jgi:hypothetical protein
VSDTPPAEYLYLDTERTLAYLGQIEGGLSETEKRVESRSNKRSASIKDSLSSEVTGEQSVERVVTAKATDRFLTLLVKLRQGGKGDDSSRKWLYEIDARLTAENSVDRIRKLLGELREGDFVRIADAQLFLAPFAAAVPKARYASSYLGGQIVQPARSLYAPIRARAQAELDKYLLQLGPDPSLPFVLPTLSEGRDDPRVVTFLVPARYTALLDNARLLAGNLTVVGKVIYKDPRLPGEKTCLRPNHQGLPCRYFDRETLTTFAPALQKAPHSVLHSLGLARSQAARAVREAVTFEVPLVVVLPLAIYQ